jgi:hypothetical protein
MTTGKRLVIVDIGSHKLEELLVLLGPFRRQLGIYLAWAARKTIKAILTMNLSAIGGLRRQLAVVRYYFLARRRYDLQVISVEPNTAVARPYVQKLGRRYPVHYMPVAVLGHDADEKAELKTLFFYGPSISSSLYRKANRAADTEKAQTCVGLKFDVMWDGLIKEGVIRAEDPFLLRMNCEGAELGVIEACVQKGLKPLCVIGSIGDVDKIHGRQMGDKTRRLIGEMGARYFYFKGDDPATWYDMIPVWEEFAGRFRKHA